MPWQWRRNGRQGIWCFRDVTLEPCYKWLTSKLTWHMPRKLFASQDKNEEGIEGGWQRKECGHHNSTTVQQPPTGNGSAPNKALLKFFNSLDIFAFRSVDVDVAIAYEKYFANSPPVHTTVTVVESQSSLLHSFIPPFLFRSRQPRSECCQVYWELATTKLTPCAHFLLGSSAC